MTQLLQIQADSIQRELFNQNSLFSELISIHDSIGKKELYVLYTDVYDDISNGNLTFMVLDNNDSIDYNTGSFSDNYKTVLINGDVSANKIIQVLDTSQNNTHTYVASSSLYYCDDVLNKLGDVFNTMKSLYSLSSSLVEESASLVVDKQILINESIALNSAITSLKSVDAGGFTTSQDYFEFSQDDALQNVEIEFFVVGGTKPYYINQTEFNISKNDSFISITQDKTDLEKFVMSVKPGYTPGINVFTISDARGFEEIGVIKLL